MGSKVGGSETQTFVTQALGAHALGRVLIALYVTMPPPHVACRWVRSAYGSDPSRGAQLLVLCEAPSHLLVAGDSKLQGFRVWGFQGLGFRVWASGSKGIGFNSLGFN